MNKKAFTLVELVVVMVIVTIISTIGFMTFSKKLVAVRDSNRITQINNIRDGIALKLNNGITIKPEGSVEIQFDGVKKLYQGYFGPSLIKKIGYSMDGVDPKDKNYFTYVISANGKYFQIMALLEEESSLEGIGYSKSQIIDNNGRVPYVVGSKELGIFFNDEVVPVHEYASSPLNILSTDNNLYNVILRNDKIVSSTGANIFSQIDNIIKNYGDNVYSCASEIYNYADYVVGNPSVSNTPWQNTDSGKPCYFSCKTGFTWNGTICNASVLSRTIACTGEPAYALWNTATQVDQVWDINSGDYIPTNIGVYNINTSLTECRFKCPTNYGWNGTSCVAGTQNGNCTGLLANTVWNTSPTILQTWNGSIWSPSLNASYSLAGSTSECRYKCATNYTWNGTSCNANTQNGNCSGLPSNAVWNSVSSLTQTWDGTSWLPSVTGNYNLTGSTSECRYKCATNYTWNGTSCNANTQNGTCSGLPSNASWNTATNITQTWNGSSFLPTTVGIYNESISTSECRFKCNVGYAWNGSSCNLSPLADFKLVLVNKCGIAGATFDANFNNTTGTYTGDINCASKGLTNSDLDKFLLLKYVTGYLDVSGNNFPNLAGLAGLKSVGTNLKLSNNNLNSISNLTLLTSVPNVYLNNNSLHDINGIQNITNLNILNASNNLISDISSISGKTTIKEIYLWNNSLASISILSTIRPDILYIYGNPSITNLSSLDGYNINSKILALDDRIYTTKISALSTVCINWNIKNQTLSSFTDITKVCKNPSGSYVNFEGYTTGLWYAGVGTNENGPSYGWYFDTGYTSSSYTGPNKGYDGDTYLFVETSNAGLGYSSKESYLYYDIVDSSNFINFYYHAYGVNIGEMEVETYDGDSRTTKYTIEGQQHTSYTQAWTKTPDITIPSGTTEIRLHYKSGSGYQGDFAIDAIRVGQK